MAFYNDKVKKADILVWAGSVKDRYLSSRWKMFFDRSFFNTHIPTMTGKQMAVIVSGPLRGLANLRQILEFYPEFGRANLVGIVTDEYGSSSEIDALLQDLAQRMVRYAEAGYIKPRTFLSVGGMKIFRDDIYSHMRFPFVADHRYYKQHGLYDFPQKKLGSRLFSSMMILLTKIPGMRKEIYVKRLKGEMVKPFQAVLAR
jgi:multimeric flavodoxin WrbA